MRKILMITTGFIFVLAAISLAEKAGTFNEARELSARLGKPILMEFVHED